MSVSSILLGLVFVGRAAFVFPLSALSNWRRKSPDERITFKQQASVLPFFHLYPYDLVYMFLSVLSSSI